MSKRKKISDAEVDQGPRKKQNKALLMAIMMILAVGIPSAMAAYYLMGVNNDSGVDYGDNPDNGDTGSGENPYAPGTHMVLAEMFVTTTCPHCADAEADMSSMLAERSDFYFVSMVADANKDAYYRYNQISQKQGVPDTEFDGGRRSELGAVGKATFEGDIDYCKDVAVPSVDISGSARMLRTDNISVELKITSSGAFHGYVRAFVIEKQSRYTNVKGESIPNAFLGYAANESLNIDASNPYIKSTVWQGSNINPSNTAIIVAAYDSHGYVVSAYEISV